MQARARAVAVADDERQGEESEAAAAALTTPAGVQMHEHVARMLQTALEEISTMGNLPRQGITASTAVRSQANREGSWLARVLTACNTAITVATHVKLFSAEGSGDVPPAWHPESSVSVAILDALTSAGPVVAEKVHEREGLTALEQAALGNAAVALYDHRKAYGTTPLSEALRTMLPPLETIFSLETTTVADAFTSHFTQSVRAPTAAEPLRVFDDDLDMAPPHASSAVPTTQM